VRGCLRRRSHADLESIKEQGLRRSQFDMAALYDVAALLCRRGRAGSAMFAAVLSSRPTWRRAADSHPEIQLRHALAAVGVHLEAQLSLMLRNGQVVHPDLGDSAARFYIEIDDHEWHGGRLDAMYDLQRDRQARLVGARIERVSTDEIDAMPSSLITSLVAAYRQQQALSQLAG
jgi:very-short-patch-repair endonuclease